MSKLFYLLLSALLFSALAFAEIAEDTETEKAAVGDDDAEFDSDVEGFFFHTENTEQRMGDDEDDEHRHGAGVASDKKYQCGKRGALIGKYAEAARLEDNSFQGETDADANAENNVETDTDAETAAEGTRLENADNADNAETDNNDENADAEDESVRMVGGRQTTPNEFPWQVSIFWKGKHVCSGAIIGKRYIVTNAHCFKSRQRRHFKIFAGKTYKDADEEGSVGPFKIEAIVIHGKYGKGGNKHDNDIALIKLNKNFRFSRKVSPVCLPEQSEKVPKSRRCYVSAFAEAKGTLEDGELKAARVSVISNKQCRRKASSWIGDYLSGNMICAGGLSTDNGSTCKGDSGSPLICEAKPRSNVYILQGLFSFGKDDCYASKKVPAAYTRLSEYVLWLKKNYRRLQKFKSTGSERLDNGEEEATEGDTRLEGFEEADQAVLADEE